MTLLPQVHPQSVSELTRELKDLVEANLDTVCVCGEISNCKAASSGHVYLTLKDDSAQLASVIWRSTAARLSFHLQDGLQVIAIGSVEVYPARGTYQLIVNRLFPQGVGALELALRQLRDKLATEGLFDPERKRPLPQLPKRIALVTSPHGAAVKDMLQVITRRWPAANIVIVPVAVQGESAPGEIAAAMRFVHLIPDVDVAIVGRGGGSIEDLMAFNSEVVARAISDCGVPVISAVGHEIDVTIADLVADRRALTPSEAGELVVPNLSDVRASLESFEERLIGGLKDKAVNARVRLDAISSRPVLAKPVQRIRQLTEQTDDLDERIRKAIQRQFETARQRMAALSQSLDALSPLAVLARGYSVTFRNEATEGNDVQRGSLVRAADQLAIGDRLVTYLERGRVLSRVESVDLNPT